MSRKETGLVMRLALPIMLLALLSAFIFWSNIHSRADSTTTLLLTVSALYIVIFANIPMLGYLTKFDNFVLCMFGILFACVSIHQLTNHLHTNDIQKWPLKRLLIRILEFLGRTLIVPIVISLFLFAFSNAFTYQSIVIGIISFIIFIIIIAPRELYAFIKELKFSIHELNMKIESNEDITNIEKWFLDFYHNHIMKTSKIMNENENIQSNNALKIHPSPSIKNNEIEKDSCIMKIEE